MLTGVALPGIRAMLVLLRKNAKTSLKTSPTNSLYSSEPKTYLNFNVLPCGMKSNSRMQASLVVKGATIVVRAASPGRPRLVLAKAVEEAATTSLASPVLRTIPLSKPMTEEEVLPPPENRPKEPAAPKVPLKLTFETVMP